MDEKPNVLFDSEKTVFFSWSYSRRSEDIAALLGIPYHYFPLSRKRRLFQFPLLLIRTVSFFFRTHPQVIFVQHPPVHVLFPVLIYSLLFGVRFVIDSHITPGTTLVERPHHHLYLLLHRFYSFFAAITLFHSHAILEKSRGWMANCLVLENPVRELTLANPFPVERRPAVGMVTSFSPDEHVDEVVEAARKSPYILFFITGFEEKIPPELKKNAPENVLFTGYLTGVAYYEFLNAMDLIIVLTDREESALLGAYESISTATPLIVSATRTMRRCLPIGAVFTENNAGSICRAIETGLLERKKLKAEIEQLKQMKLAQQKKDFGLIADAVNQ